MWLAGGFHWVTVKGRQASPTEAAILTVAPHSSYFDAISVTMTMASIVMKAESKDIPVWGSKLIEMSFLQGRFKKKNGILEISPIHIKYGRWGEEILSNATKFHLNKGRGGILLSYLTYSVS